MKRTAIWMGLLLMAVSLSAAAAAEPRVELTPPGLGMSPAGCAQMANLPATPAELERVIFSPSETRPVDVANACCSIGCCTHIDSGCQPCGASGRKWYDKYSCPGGGTCTVSASSCPTPC